MNKENSNDEISIRQFVIKCREWVIYFMSKWKIILLFGLLGSVLGLTYSLLNKPSYIASLSFVIEDEKGGSRLSGALGLASQFGFDVSEGGGNIFSGSNLIELFKSRTMVEKALLNPVLIGEKTISFAEMYIQNLNWRDKWPKKANLSNIQFLPNADRQKFSREQDSILGIIYSDISNNNLRVAQKDKKIGIISIDMQSGNEYFSKLFTETLAKEVSDFYIQTKSKKNRINLDILERQTDSIRAELNKAITGVAIANDNTFSLNPALNIRRTPSAKRQVDVQANTAILTELVKQTELAKVTLRKETPLIQIIDRPILPLKKEKFGKLKGILIGGFLAGFIIIIIILFKRLWDKMMSLT